MACPFSLKRPGASLEAAKHIEASLVLSARSGVTTIQVGQNAHRLIEYAPILISAQRCLRRLLVPNAVV